ncbi:hypothetical protein CSOJ01_09160 [Colletotrichum sojae]|uniref:Uncharacterized protein n=1 Tax=Colletotrichum sojae TaxID=2175907 RepID=A0A8H6MR11_9PEZI|nr:hypothetical protein CSOJ01_09160 [Colletotrichum sojae]
MASLRIDGSISASNCLFGDNVFSNALVQCSGPNGDGRNGEEQQRPAFSAGRGNSAEPLAEVRARRPTLSSEWIRKLSRPSDVRYCSENAEVGRKVCLKRPLALGAWASNGRATFRVSATSVRKAKATRRGAVAVAPGSDSSVLRPGGLGAHSHLIGDVPAAPHHRVIAWWITNGPNSPPVKSSKFTCCALVTRMTAISCAAAD